MVNNGLLTNNRLFNYPNNQDLDQSSSGLWSSLDTTKYWSATTPTSFSASATTSAAILAAGSTAGAGSIVSQVDLKTLPYRRTQFGFFAALYATAGIQSGGAFNVYLTDGAHTQSIASASVSSSGSSGGRSGMSGGGVVDLLYDGVGQITIYVQGGGNTLGTNTFSGTITQGSITLLTTGTVVDVSQWSAVYIAVSITTTGAAGPVTGSVGITMPVNVASFIGSNGTQ